MYVNLPAGMELDLKIAKHILKLPVYPYMKDVDLIYPHITSTSAESNGWLYWAAPETDAYEFSPSVYVEQAMEIASQLGLFEDVWLTQQEGQWFCVSMFYTEGVTEVEGDIIQGCSTAAEAICNCLLSLQEGE